MKEKDWNILQLLKPKTIIFWVLSQHFESILANYVGPNVSNRSQPFWNFSYAEKIHLVSNEMEKKKFNIIFHETEKAEKITETKFNKGKNASF